MQGAIVTRIGDATGSCYWVNNDKTVKRVTESDEQNHNKIFLYS